MHYCRQIENSEKYKIAYSKERCYFFIYWTFLYLNVQVVF